MQYGKLRKKFGKKLVTGLSLCLSAFLLCGMSADAAEKETSLVNLAEGLTTVTDSQGNALTNAELLTDEDRYYLQYNEAGNKVSGSSVTGTNGGTGWEAYIEQGAQIGSDAKWIQMDLGASYPIEVINLKRRMYDGVSTTSMSQGHSGRALRYNDTVVVIGNQENLSDGYVVYYNDADGSVELPDGVQAPANKATGGMTESMAGTYFYMDNTNKNGTGYTDLGTTKTARYIRVYSDNPDADEDLMFMELAVYGYKSEGNIQEYSKRKVINNENPLMIAAAYSDDQWHLGQEEQVGLQGFNTIAGRWNCVADDLKDNTVLMMHSNNLRSFAPHYIGQAYLHGYYEACLKEGYECGASTMLMLVNASSVQGGAHWCITRDLDYHWIDLMYRKYPNLEGVFSTENMWSGYHGQVAEAVAALLEISDNHGGYVVYAEDGAGTYETLASNASLKSAVMEHGDALFFTYKNTTGPNDCLATQSHIMGSWLAGYTGGWGMLSDSWAWGNSGKGGPIYQPRGYSQNDWNPLCAEPAAIFGMQMLNTYLAGGVVYTFEFPEVIYGAIDTNSPTYTHVVERVFRYICDNPGPSREDILNDTEVMIYGTTPSSLYAKTTGEDNFLGIFRTGRYGAIPSVPAWQSIEDMTQTLKETAKKEGTAAPIVMANGDGILGYGGKDYLDSLYELEYLGDAFADKYNGEWYIYNSTANSDIDQYATLPLEAGEGTARLTATIEAHTFLTLEEKKDSIDISLNNYRYDGQEICFDNKYGWEWNGSSATGQGISRAKLTVYRYMAYYNCVNAQTGVPYYEIDEAYIQSKFGGVKPDTIDQLSPNDNELRTTTFELTKLSKEPTVKVVKGQAPDTDGQVQYKDPVVVFDETTGKATITVETNGWVELKVSDLEFAEDADAPAIEETPEEPDEEPDEEEPEVEPVNVASGKTVTASHAAGVYPFSRVTDGTTACTSGSGAGDCTWAAWGDAEAAVWAQIDLESVQDITEVKMWRYFKDRDDNRYRFYKDTVIMLSEKASFPENETLVIWNANDDASQTWVDSEGSGTTHTLPLGEDPLYYETSEGKKFTVYGDNVKWLNGTNTNVPAEGETFKARYVRVYMNGNSTYNDEEMKNHHWTAGSSHLIEVQVMAMPGEDTTVSYENLAPKASISVSSPASRALSKVVDGDFDINQFVDPGGYGDNPHPGPQWLQLDMGINHKINSVSLWRYTNRSYYNTAILLSTDKDFAPESTLVLWNADNASTGLNSAKVAAWPGDGNGQTGTHTLPEGTDPIYNETSAGRTFKVTDSSVKWLDGNTERPKPTETFDARYLRVYMNGSTSNESHHIVEIEVNGIEGEFVLEDKEKPEQVTGIEVIDKNTTSATITFLPSMDNMGVKGYEMTVSKEGEEPKVIELNQTRYELTGLESGAEYTVSIVAVDYFDNKSEPSTYVFETYEENDFIVTASVASGKYEDTQNVTLSVGADAGEIYYTLDGTEPFDEDGNLSATAKKYSSENGVIISKSGTLHAALKLYDKVWPTSAFFYLIGGEEHMDFEAPAAPTGVTVTETSSTGAIISWNSGSDADIAAFNVYVDGVKVSSQNVTRMAASQAVITDLAPGTAYQIYVTAVDEAGNESLRSKTVEFVTRLQ